MTALTAAAAQISVPLPFTPVPFTLQPMIVLLGGAVLGPRLGWPARSLYLAAGLAGLPVFAFSPELPQGAARLIGPTGGYLMAYPLAAFVTGAWPTRGFDRRYLTSVLAMTAGLAVDLRRRCDVAGAVCAGRRGRSLERRWPRDSIRSCWPTPQALPGRRRHAGRVAARRLRPIAIARASTQSRTSAGYSQ